MVRFQAVWRVREDASVQLIIPHCFDQPLIDGVLQKKAKWIAILEELKPLTGGGKCLFPGERSRDRPMSNNTVNASLRRLGYAEDEMTGHGFGGCGWMDRMNASKPTTPCLTDGPWFLGARGTLARAHKTTAGNRSADGGKPGGTRYDDGWLKSGAPAP